MVDGRRGDGPPDGRPAIELSGLTKRYRRGKGWLTAVNGDRNTIRLVFTPTGVEHVDPNGAVVAMPTRGYLTRFRPLRAPR